MPSIPSSLPASDKRNINRLNKLAFAMHCAQRVTQLCRELRNAPSDSTSESEYALETAIVVTYEKVFNACKELGELGGDANRFPDTTLRSFHEEIRASRDTVYAHSVPVAFEVVLVVVGCDTSPIAFSEVSEMRLNRDLVPKIEELSLDIRERLRSEFDLLSKRLMIEKRSRLGDRIPLVHRK